MELRWSSNNKCTFLCASRNVWLNNLWSINEGSLPFNKAIKINWVKDSLDSFSWYELYPGGCSSRLWRGPFDCIPNYPEMYAILLYPWPLLLSLLLAQFSLFKFEILSIPSKFLRKYPLSTLYAASLIPTGKKSTAQKFLALPVLFLGIWYDTSSPSSLFFLPWWSWSSKIDERGWLNEVD